MTNVRKIEKCPECMRQYSLGYNAGNNKGMANRQAVDEYYKERIQQLIDLLREYMGK